MNNSDLAVAIFLAVTVFAFLARLEDDEHDFGYIVARSFLWPLDLIVLLIRAFFDIVRGK